MTRHDHDAAICSPRGTARSKSSVVVVAMETSASSPSGLVVGEVADDEVEDVAEAGVGAVGRAEVDPFPAGRAAVGVAGAAGTASNRGMSASIT